MALENNVFFFAQDKGEIGMKPNLYVVFIVSPAGYPRL